MVIYMKNSVFTQFRMIFIFLIFSLIADQVSGQVALIPKFEAGNLGKGWTIGRHRETRNHILKHACVVILNS